MKRMKWTAAVLAAAALVWSAGAGQSWAVVGSDQKEEEKTYTLDKVVVTARGVESTVSQTPGGVSVMEPEEIAIDQPMSISDELARMPGVNVSRDAAWGSEVNIRGLSRGSLVFNLDGARVNTATQMGAQFGTIAPNEIERIEVLKGPVSALYGSGSIGGVINILTRKGEFTAEPTTRSYLTTSYTSNPEGFNGYFNTSYNSPDVWVYASGSWRDHESYEAGDGEEIPNSQYGDYSAKLRAGVKWLGGVTDVQVQHLEGEDIGIPGTGVAPLPTAADITYPSTRRTLLSMQHTIEDLSDIYKETSLQFYYQTINRRVVVDNFPAASAVSKLTPNADHATMGGNWRNVFALGDHQLVTGLDVWNWNIESSRTKYLASGLVIKDKPLPDADYFSGGVYAEDNWTLSPKWALNLGGRLDYIHVENDDNYLYVKPPKASSANPLITEAETKEDISWNLHAGLTWSFLPDWSMSFLAASAYRAASMEERFSYIALSSGATKYGNPELEPERSFFFEYGLHYNTPNLGATASAYANYLNDMISEVYTSDTVITYENLSEARIYGAELEAYWVFLPGARLYGNLAYTNGEDTDTDEYLPYIPPLSGLVGIRYDHPSGLWARIELTWAADQDNTPPSVETTEGWQSVGARLGYRFDLLKTEHEVVLGVENVFDEDYRNYLATSRGVELKEPGFSFLAVYRLWF
jgi:hemoglobin/transferrin/lactoferrin receptor protein